jgi:hypothetical protein
MYNQKWSTLIRDLHFSFFFLLFSFFFSLFSKKTTPAPPGWFKNKITIKILSALADSHYGAVIQLELQN